MASCDGHHQRWKCINNGTVNFREQKGTNKLGKWEKFRKKDCDPDIREEFFFVGIFLLFSIYSVLTNFYYEN